MKILTSFVIALLGGIIAITLYKAFEERPASPRDYPRTDGMGRPISYTAAVDSINNVFNVGFGEAAERSLAQVVHIRSRIVTQMPQDPFFEYFGEGFWGQEYKNRQYQRRQLQEASGSGVIVQKDGFIVTNNHVIANAEEIIVSLNDGRDYKAEVIGADPATDLAVIKIEQDGLSPAVLANSDNVRVGDWVLAVGNPFNLASTVTAGIVSAKARNIHILSDNLAIESFIQTDAAVNPGNSGGALVNIAGELIGINTAIATPTGTFAGYAFAVPSNIVGKVMNDLIQYGEVHRGYMGVVIQDLEWQLAQDMGLDQTQGVVVVNLARNGAADEAGMEVRDVILEIEGTPIEGTPRLQEIVASHAPGDVLDVVVLRDGKKRELEIKLQDLEELQEARR